MAHGRTVRQKCCQKPSSFHRQIVYQLVCRRKYFNMDGRFAHHHRDPTSTSVEDSYTLYYALKRVAQMSLYT